MNLFASLCSDIFGYLYVSFFNIKYTGDFQSPRKKWFRYFTAIICGVYCIQIVVARRNVH